MRIALTGASGFVGRYVLNELILQKQQVVAITRNATKIKSLDEYVQVVEMDISLPIENSFDQLGRPDILIHLAWDGLPNYNSLHHFEQELPRQYSFLKKMIESGLKSVFVTGTCFEYGMLSGALSEDLSVCPSNPYGFAKNALYNQLKFLNNEYRFGLTWARLFYIYGSGQPGTSLYQQLKTAVLKGSRSFDMSGGEQLRDYSKVEEIAKLIVNLAVNKKGLDIVNLCSGKPISVRRLIEKWFEDEGWDIKLNIGKFPYSDYEPMAFWGDRSLLDNIFKK